MILLENDKKPMTEIEEMFDLAETLRELREQKTDLEKELEEVKTLIEKTDFQPGQELPVSERMAETETQNFTRSGTMFYLTTKTRASAVAGSKEELYDALRREGFGDLVYETVNANSLSAFVKEQITENEDELPDWLDGLVNVFDKTTVGVRKAKK